VAQAWDLNSVAGEYRQFMNATVLRDSTQQDPFARQVLLLNSWRRLPLRDPGLHWAGLPSDWPGHSAARMFLERFEAQQPDAEAAWRRILSESEPEDRNKTSTG